jgi:uncharacterized protein involved in oxidation of intracellular sulfur
MQRIVIIANGAAYGSESLFNSLRLAIALREQQSDLDLKLFLPSPPGCGGRSRQKGIMCSRCWRSSPPSRFP